MHWILAELSVGSGTNPEKEDVERIQMIRGLNTCHALVLERRKKVEIHEMWSMQR